MKFKSQESFLTLMRIAQKEAYDEVMRRSSYYLVETKALLALPEAV